MNYHPNLNNIKIALYKLKTNTTMKKLELKDNQIMIFKSKKDTEKQPDYRGQLMINNEVKDVTLWINKSKAGNKYLNGLISEPKEVESKDDIGF